MNTHYRIDTVSNIRGTTLDAASRFHTIPPQRRSPTLSRRELRGIVADMLG